MLSMFGSLKNLTKAQQISIDSFVCKLHYRATVIILLVFSILVTATQYYGDPIKCMSADSKIPNDMMETYCWIHSTFSLTTAWNKEVGKEVIYPGVDKAVGDKDVIYHTYYLWVPFVLFSMAITFYVPRYIWKIQEGERIKALVLGLGSAIIPDDLRQNGINVMVNYFRNNLKNNNGLFVSYIFCEVLNFVNISVQIHLLNRFLGGLFLGYGWKIIMYNDWEPNVKDDPMVRVFPTLTKCRFYSGGPSGDVTKHDALCLIPINILNQKIFIFLWFWFLILLLISGVSLVTRVMTLTMPFVRTLITASHCYPKNRSEADRIIRLCNFGDWFLLHLISKNVDRNTFNEFVVKFNETSGLTKEA